MRTPLKDRLLARVVVTGGGCWEWQGFRDRGGYGRIARGGHAEGSLATHRAAWEVTYGPIPDGMWVLHKCDNPPCCNPDHLFLGTAADNNADMRAKGRQVNPSGAAHGMTKYTAAQVALVQSLAAQGWSQRRIARHVGCSRGHAHYLINKRSAAIRAVAEAHPPK